MDDGPEPRDRTKHYVASASAVIPRHLLDNEFVELKERVNQQYGAFGVRAAADDEQDEQRVRLDDGLHTAAWTIAGVAAASTFLAFASAPSWSGPGEWSSGFRLDTIFIAVWGPLLVWMAVRQKLPQILRTYLVLALFIEAFSEVMFRAKGEGGYWDSVLWPAAVAYFGTLKEFSGMPGASLSVFSLLTVGLLARAVWGKNNHLVRPPPFAAKALHVVLATIAIYSILGVVGGGPLDWTFRQVIHLAQLPLVALLFLYVLRVPEDLPAVGTIFVLTAFVRSLLVIFVYVAVCMPKGIHLLPGKPEWCTNHSDTVLFVSAVVILIAYVMEHGAKTFAKPLVVGLVIMIGIVLNNRRLGFVSVAAAPLLLYLALDPSRRKRRVTMALALLVPLAIGYVLVGSETTSASPLLRPAKSIASIFEQTDNSALSRDIENENLIYTLRQHPLVTKGFGHEYEFSPDSPPVDLSQVYSNYRLIAHNGVLWLWSVLGVIGFPILWFLYSLSGTLAFRSYRGGRTPLERTAALASFGGVAVCVIQIWGDQGLESYLTLVTFGVCFAVASRLALRAEG